MKIFNEKNIKKLDSIYNKKLENLIGQYEDVDLSHIKKFDNISKKRMIDLTLKMTSLLLDYSYKLDKLEVRDDKDTTSVY